ncbi:hypothetical protein KC131_13300 [Pseudomonas sp. JQ170]|uniref:hypothetical protein n=1 Tax=unclassified Pseudomonas TaxID=196821 RepID=UPI002654B9BC|nr:MULTISPECIES: hypothetical protein [unclassified Pseudomonas]MDN7141618.1 hypothetical protein [Pseudomonas sp. JQ170]WRO75485.1 hypothetical protein U9R80_23905 [Pseudomonas sp. 170C]
MKRTAISGLFIAAALLASPVFAAEDLCNANLQKISDNMATAGATSEGANDAMNKEVDRAKAAQAAGNEKDCIAITSKVLEKQGKAEKGDSGA